MFNAACASVMREFVRRASFPILLGWLLAAPPAMAGLMLHPTRLVFEKNQRASQVELINDGTESATYRISLVNRRMSDDGQIAVITEPGPGEQFADSMLVFSPRQITLAPGTAQTVRVMVRRPASLANGEYRSHLLFEKQPDPGAASSVETQNQQGIGIVLNVLVGASIPVIVRQGETSVTAGLSHLALQRGADGKPVIALQIDRNGTRSLYGDLQATFTPSGGAPAVAATLNGMAVYTPNPIRRTLLPVTVPAATTLAHGILRVTYRERPDAGGKLLAEATLDLP
jgi:P pilus assembly chaperone PapD